MLHGVLVRVDAMTGRPVQNEDIVAVSKDRRSPTRLGSPSIGLLDDRGGRVGRGRVTCSKVGCSWSLQIPPRVPAGRYSLVAAHMGAVGVSAPPATAPVTVTNREASPGDQGVDVAVDVAVSGSGPGSSLLPGDDVEVTVTRHGDGKGASPQPVLLRIMAEDTELVRARAAKPPGNRSAREADPGAAAGKEAALPVLSRDGVLRARLRLPETIPAGAPPRLEVTLVAPGPGEAAVPDRVVPLPMAPRSVRVLVSPEGSALVAGLQARVYVQASLPTGEPADVVARICEVGASDATRPVGSAAATTSSSLGPVSSWWSLRGGQAPPAELLGAGLPPRDTPDPEAGVGGRRREPACLATVVTAGGDGRGVSTRFTPPLYSHLELVVTHPPGARATVPLPPTRAAGATIGFGPTGDGPAVALGAGPLAVRVSASNPGAVRVSLWKRERLLAAETVHPGGYAPPPSGQPAAGPDSGSGVVGAARLALRRLASSSWDAVFGPTSLDAEALLLPPADSAATGVLRVTVTETTTGVLLAERLLFRAPRRLLGVHLTAEIPPQTSSAGLVPEPGSRGRRALGAAAGGGGPGAAGRDAVAAAIALPREPVAGGTPWYAPEQTASAGGAAAADASGGVAVLGGFRPGSLARVTAQLTLDGLPIPGIVRLRFRAEPHGKWSSDASAEGLEELFLQDELAAESKGGGTMTARGGAYLGWVAGAAGGASDVDAAASSSASGWWSWLGGGAGSKPAAGPGGGGEEDGASSVWGYMADAMRGVWGAGEEGGIDQEGRGGGGGGAQGGLVDRRSAASRAVDAARARLASGPLTALDLLLGTQPWRAGAYDDVPAFLGSALPLLSKGQDLTSFGVDGPAGQQGPQAGGGGRPAKLAPRPWDSSGASSAGLADDAARVMGLDGRTFAGTTVVVRQRRRHGIDEMEALADPQPGSRSLASSPAAPRRLAGGPAAALGASGTLSALLSPAVEPGSAASSWDDVHVFPTSQRPRSVNVRMPGAGGGRVLVEVLALASEPRVGVTPPASLGAGSGLVGLRSAALVAAEPISVRISPALPALTEGDRVAASAEVRVVPSLLEGGALAAVSARWSASGPLRLVAGEGAVPVPMAAPGAVGSSDAVTGRTRAELVAGWDGGAAAAGPETGTLTVTTTAAGGGAAAEAGASSSPASVLVFPAGRPGAVSVSGWVFPGAWSETNITVPRSAEPSSVVVSVALLPTPVSAATLTAASLLRRPGASLLAVLAPVSPLAAASRLLSSSRFAPAPLVEAAGRLVVVACARAAALQHPSGAFAPFPHSPDVDYPGTAAAVLVLDDAAAAWPLAPVRAARDARIYLTRRCAHSLASCGGAGPAPPDATPPPARILGQEAESPGRAAAPASLRGAFAAWCLLVPTTFSPHRGKAASALAVARAASRASLTHALDELAALMTSSGAAPGGDAYLAGLAVGALAQSGSADHTPAVLRGMALLAASQLPDGSVAAGNATVPQAGAGERRVQATAVALLAWLGPAAAADDGAAGRASMAAQWLEAQRSDGRFGGPLTTVLASRALTAHGVTAAQALRPSAAAVVEARAEGGAWRSLHRAPLWSTGEPATGASARAGAEGAGDDLSGIANKADGLVERGSVAVVPASALAGLVGPGGSLRLRLRLDPGRAPARKQGPSLNVRDILSRLFGEARLGGLGGGAGLERRPSPLDAVFGRTGGRGRVLLGGEGGTGPLGRALLGGEGEGPGPKGAPLVFVANDARDGGVRADGGAAYGGEDDDEDDEGDEEEEAEEEEEDEGRTRPVAGAEGPPPPPEVLRLGTADRPGAWAPARGHPSVAAVVSVAWFEPAEAAAGDEAAASGRLRPRVSLPAEPRLGEDVSVTVTLEEGPRLARARDAGESLVVSVGLPVGLAVEGLDSAATTADGAALTGRGPRGVVLSWAGVPPAGSSVVLRCRAALEGSFSVPRTSAWLQHDETDSKGEAALSPRLVVRA